MSSFVCLASLPLRKKKKPTLCKNYKILHWQICSSTFTLSLLFVQEMDRRCHTVLWPYRDIFNTLAECSRTWHGLCVHNCHVAATPHPQIIKKEKKKRKRNQQQQQTVEWSQCYKLIYNLNSPSRQTAVWFYWSYWSLPACKHYGIY